MRVILFILKLIGRILLIPLWLILAFIGVCVSAVVNLYCVAKGLVGLLLGAMLVCTIIWYRTQYMNYILLPVVWEPAISGMEKAHDCACPKLQAYPPIFSLVA